MKGWKNQMNKMDSLNFELTNSDWMKMNFNEI